MRTGTVSPAKKTYRSSTRARPRPALTTSRNSSELPESHHRFSIRKANTPYEPSNYEPSNVDGSATSTHASSKGSGGLMLHPLPPCAPEIQRNHSQILGHETLKRPVKRERELRAGEANTPTASHGMNVAIPTSLPQPATNLSTARLDTRNRSYGLPGIVELSSSPFVAPETTSHDRLSRVLWPFHRGLLRLAKQEDGPSTTHDGPVVQTAQANRLPQQRLQLRQRIGGALSDAPYQRMPDGALHIRPVRTVRVRFLHLVIRS